MDIINKKAELIPPNGKYRPVQTEQELNLLVEILSQGEVLCIDTETTSVDPLDCELLGIAITHQVGQGWYIPVQRELEEGDQISFLDKPEEYLPLPLIRELLLPIIENSKVIYMHHAKYDIHVLERHGFPIKFVPYGTKIVDTMLGAYVLGNVHGTGYGLKDLTKRKLGFRMLEFKEVTNKGKKPFWKLPIELATSYAAADVDMTLRLSGLIEQGLEQSPTLKRTYQLEIDTIPVLIDMEKNGTLIDQKYLRSVGKTLLEKLEDISNEFNKVAREEINLNSNPQILKFFQKELPNERITNVDKYTLAYLKDKHPLARVLKEYREVKKLHSTYIEGILDKVKLDGRLHTDFYQMLKTGRLSSSKPNLQNLPKNGFEPSVRRAIVASEGYKLGAIDYSQLELRVITHISQDPVWMEAYRQDKDIHQETANMLDIERYKAKTVNFGILYGESAFGLSKRLEISVGEAEDFLEKYFSKLTGVRDYIETRKMEVLRRGYVETPHGRRLYFRFDRKDRKAIAAAQREGINMPIQGFAADITKRAMVACRNFLLEENSRTKMLIQVHDEIVFEIPDEEFDTIIIELASIMRETTKLSIPLKVDIEYGDNWEDLEEL